MVRSFSVLLILIVFLLTIQSAHAEEPATAVVGRGTVFVNRAPDDNETRAGIIVAGHEQVLAKFRFEVVHEDMLVDGAEILVAPTSIVGVSSLGTADEVPMLTLYDGTTQLGTYAVNNSGSRAGVAFIDGLSWMIPKDHVKTLTVTGLVSSMSACAPGDILDNRCTGADTGASVWIQFLDTGFVALGSTAKQTSIPAAVSGREKIVYKSVPRLEALDHTYSLTGTGSPIPSFKFRVYADGEGAVAVKKLPPFKVAMVDATLVSASTDRVLVYDLATGTLLTLSEVYSGVNPHAPTHENITSGEVGYVSTVFHTEEVVPAGSYKDYEVRFTYHDLNTVGGAAPKAIIGLHNNDTTKVAALPCANVLARGASIVWSDLSATIHSEDSSDWHNGRYVDVDLTPKVLNGGVSPPPPPVPVFYGLDVSWRSGEFFVVPVFIRTQGHAISGFRVAVGIMDLAGEFNLRGDPHVVLADWVEDDWEISSNMVDGNLVVSAAGVNPLPEFATDGMMIFCIMMPADPARGTRISFWFEEEEATINEGEVVPTAPWIVTVRRGYGDITGDGTISPLDVSMILRFFVGLEKFDEDQMHAAEVSGDGEVTPYDAVLVLQYVVGLIGAFPVNQGKAAPTLQGKDLDDLIRQLDELPLTPEEQGVLEELKRQIGWREPPEKTMLLPNFPNPFNPETWIPYSLSESAEVLITVYDLEGDVVRTAFVGYQHAGHYDTRETAFYWDGKNASGEQVASGVYFYQLSAGHFSAIRKMVILK
jgi:hypothetical protein